MIARLLVLAASLALMGCAEDVHPPRGMPPPPSELSGYAESGPPELPVVLSRVKPDYPDEARRAGVQGTVWVNVLVRTDGSTHEMKVIGSVPMLNKAAKACVEHWQFKPGTLNGRPVELWLAVPVEFVLADAR